MVTCGWRAARSGRHIVTSFGEPPHYQPFEPAGRAHLGRRRRGRQLTGDGDATARALAAAAAESDIVLDYLWGQPAQHAIMALLTARSGRSREMTWIQIGLGGRPGDGAAVSGPAFG